MHLKYLYTIVAIALVLSGCRDSREQSGTVNIATAANMQYAMEALNQYFTDSTGIKCQLIVGSSGKLSAQIREGAPFDLFVAANMKYPAELARLGLAKETPRPYAIGTLVLWTVGDGLTPSLEILGTDTVNHIALANPMIAPYGQAAMEVLIGNGQLEQLSHKLVYGESISQTNQFILSGAAELGFTSLSVVLSPQMEGRGTWIVIDKDLHQPIEQGVILLDRDRPSDIGAKQFYDFLFSRKATEIMKKFGYSVHEPPGMPDHRN
jgi:molybdate transport system substrate-binding protein